MLVCVAAFSSDETSRSDFCHDIMGLHSDNQRRRSLFIGRAFVFRLMPLIYQEQAHKYPRISSHARPYNYAVELFLFVWEPARFAMSLEKCRLDEEAVHCKYLQLLLKF